MPDVTLVLRAVNESKAALEEAERQLRGVGDAAEDAGTKSTGGFRGAIESAGNFAFAANQLVGTLSGVANQIGEVVDKGLQIQRAENAFETYADIVGIDAAEATLKLREATGGLVSDFDLMTSGARFMSMGIAESADEAAQLAEIAVTLGSALGRGPNEAMEEFALLMANESIPRLDTFGISAGQVRTRINELLDSGQALNHSKAFRMAVIADATPKVEALGGASAIAGGNIEKLKVVGENALNAFASTVASVVDNALGFFFDLAGAIGEVIGVIDDFLGISDLLEAVGSGIGDILGGIGEALGFEAAMSPAELLARDLESVREELRGFEGADVVIDATLHDTGIRETAISLLSEDNLPIAEIAAVLADRDLMEVVTDISSATDNLPPAEIVAMLEDPELRAIVEAIRDFGDWGDAEIGVALRDGGLEAFNEEIETFGDYSPAEIAAILASDGLDEVNAAISSGEFDPAETTIILAPGGEDELQKDIDAAKLTLSARAQEGTGEAIRDDIQAELEDTPIFVGIIIDGTEFQRQGERLRELGLEDPIVIEAIIETARLNDIRSQLEALGVEEIDINAAIRSDQIDRLIQDVREEFGGSTYDIRIEADQAAFTTLVDGLRADIGDEEFLAAIGLGDESTKQLLDDLAADVGMSEAIMQLSFAFRAEDATEIVNELAVAVGRDPVELQAEFRDLEIAQLATQLDLPPVMVEAILTQGSIDDAVALIRRSGISSLELELAISGETLADMQTRLLSEPFAAAVFVDDASIWDMQQALIDAGAEVPAELTIEGVAETLREAGVDELAIATFVEEESIEGIRGQLEEIGVEDVLIDVILAGGATEQAQMIADDLVVAAEAAERMEEASQGISEALGITDVSRLTKEMEDLLAPFLSEEGQVQFGIELETTNTAEQLFTDLTNDITTKLEEGEITEAQAIEMFVELNAAMETGQVNEELLSEIQSALDEGGGGIEAAIDIAADFADSASPENMGIDLSLIGFQDMGLAADGWANAADPATMGVDQTEATFANIQTLVSDTRFTNALQDSETILANTQTTVALLEGVNISGGNGNGVPQAPENQGQIGE